MAGSAALILSAARAAHRVTDIALDGRSQDFTETIGCSAGETGARLETPEQLALVFD
jgi:hypothetical protein